MRRPRASVRAPSRVVAELAVVLARDSAAGGVTMRPGLVNSYNSGDGTVNVYVGDELVNNVDRLLSYASPAAFDRVVVLVGQPGKGSTGGWMIVIGESS